jgi:lysophospholipase L1-like esterase
MVVRASLGGTRIRISVSNMLNVQPLRIGSAHVALHASAGQTVRGTDRVISFAGNPSAVVPPGALLLSDPVDLPVAPLADLAVSLYLPVDTGPPTSHTLGLRTAYISHGDVTASESMPDPTTTLGYLWLSSVDVHAPAPASTVVAFGDSITDGYGTTLDASQAWPTLLARRFANERTTRQIAIVNQGISGNQVLRNGAGLSALARFDRDVLSRSGVKWVILLEGINDINIRGRADGPDALTADELIAAYKQIIARAHSHGIRVLGATLTPEEGVPTATERGEAIREAANGWIRTSGAFDAVVDFDAAVRDSARPIRLRPEFDPGDHIHPNDAGNRAMADAFDLKVFVK